MAEQSGMPGLMGTGAEQSGPARGPGQMSDELIALLRRRVDTRFYDQPQLVDALARRLLRLGSS